MADYRRGAFVYAKDRLLVPPEAGVGTPPDERPNGIPADLGGVYRQKDTVDIAEGYEATHRGHVLKTQRQGLTLRQTEGDIVEERGNVMRARDGRAAPGDAE